VDFAIILTTASAIEEGQSIANTLVEKQLAACVNIIPKISSVYHWEGQIQSESEVLLLIKTTKDLESEVYQEVQNVHSYDTPELITLPITNGSETYLDWMTNAVGKQHNIGDKSV
jgi:periplasmic divalent cation tolerance protein